MTRALRGRDLVSALLATAVVLVAGVLGGCGASSASGGGKSGKTTSIKVGVPGTTEP